MNGPTAWLNATGVCFHQPNGIGRRRRRHLVGAREPEIIWPAKSANVAIDLAGWVIKASRNDYQESRLLVGRLGTTVERVSECSLCEEVEGIGTPLAYQDEVVSVFPARWQPLGNPGYTLLVTRKHVRTLYGVLMHQAASSITAEYVL